MNWRILILAVVLICAALAGCTHYGEHPHSEHPSREHPRSEHPY